MSETGPLAGRTVIIPETRELDLFARMLEERGATAFRCPLVAILDAPDAAVIEAWLRRFIAGSDDLILFTGEGLRRLVGFAQRAGIEADFASRLAGVRKITRGPKPARALRELGLRPDVAADPPTTDGVIAALSGLELRGHGIGVQLYPDNPNAPLFEFIARAGATADPVLPYIYASSAEDGRVIEAIDRLAGGTADVIAFTSAPQVRRLFAVAEAGGKMTPLRDGLARTKVAAVGPVVAAELERFGISADIAPQDAYFMKPLANAIAAAFAPK
jgi:uroporphyrinogen-III synthase